MTDPSPARAIVRRLVADLGRAGAHAAIDTMLGQLSVIERAALASHWPTWARPKQLAPIGPWMTWGLLTGRGYGKTLSLAHFVNDEVEEGRARLIGLCAQDEANSVAIQVLGPSGLIATAPPWNRPRWEASSLQLVWPNGARAYVRTPEVPGKIRGLEYHLSWVSELQSWPTAHRDEALSNFRIATRIGYARMVWDATPKKRHPLIRELLAACETDPERHRVTRGSTHENADGLGSGYVAELERRIGGTQRGREEIEGEMLDDSDNAVVKSAWIDQARRNMPDRLVRRVLGIDPAVTTRAGNDSTGIIDCGVGVDGQVYVLGDYSGKHEASAWGALVLEKYVRNMCDLVVVERNKGGDLVTQNLRAAAGARGLHVVVVGEAETVQRVTGTVYVREVYARGSKEDRAQPLSTAYERGRISHVIGADLSALEDTITTWEPVAGQRSPDALDALVHAAAELLGLAENRPDPSVAFRGIAAMGRELEKPRHGAVNLAALLRGGGGGGRI